MVHILFLIFGFLAGSFANVCILRLPKNEDVFLDQLVISNIKEAYNMPRQKLPETFWQTGHIDVIKIDTILSKKSLTGDKILPLQVFFQKYLKFPLFHHISFLREK